VGERNGYDGPTEGITMANRKNVRDLSNANLVQLRSLLDRYIIKPNDNPVEEHRAAGNDMALMIHGDGFISWHQYFVARLENWLVVNGGARFVPLPYWNAAQPIPVQLDKNNNTNVNLPLPANLRPQALSQITNYRTLNNRLVPYHGRVHNPETSPSDPIFWPFHSFLVSIYERWRNR
jgi:hypothetical protein